LAGLTYPYDWGFVPSTEAEDGDPLDVLVIHDAGTYPGLILRCKPIGVLEVVQITKRERGRNDRIFAVPDRSPFEGDLQDVRHLPARAVEELADPRNQDDQAAIPVNRASTATSGIATLWRA
jgi:inorganic pyrophosphatase